MNKYDPKESITCPKCGRTYKAEVMGVRYWEAVAEGGDDLIVLTSLCGFSVHRRPLDYKEEEDE